MTTTEEKASLFSINFSGVFLWGLVHFIQYDICEICSCVPYNLLCVVVVICLHSGILLYNVQTAVRAWGDACSGGNTVSTIGRDLYLGIGILQESWLSPPQLFLFHKSIYNIKFTILTIFQCQRHYVLSHCCTSPPSISRTSLSSQTETARLLNNNCPLSSPGALETTILLSVFMNLTTLGTLYKQNHTVFVFL